MLLTQQPPRPPILKNLLPERSWERLKRQLKAGKAEGTECHPTLRFLSSCRIVCHPDLKQTTKLMSHSYCRSGLYNIKSNMNWYLTLLSLLSLIEILPLMTMERYRGRSLWNGHAERNGMESVCWRHWSLQKRVHYLSQFIIKGLHFHFINLLIFLI